jgi:hypothetical protein
MATSLYTLANVFKIHFQILRYVVYISTVQYAGDCRQDFFIRCTVFSLLVSNWLYVLGACSHIVIEAGVSNTARSNTFFFTAVGISSEKVLLRLYTTNVDLVGSEFFLEN